MVQRKSDSQAAAVANEVAPLGPSSLGIAFLVVRHRAAVLGCLHAPPHRNLEFPVRAYIRKEKKKKQQQSMRVHKRGEICRERPRRFLKY